MARIKLRDYASQNGFNMVSKVRTNASGYLFVTLLDKENPDHVENIYFGKRFAEEGGYKNGDQLRAAELFVADTINAQGEARFKLTDKEGDAEATLISMGYSDL